MARTTHRSTAGKKLYAVRTTDGKFKDIQDAGKAHAADIRKTSKAEKTATLKQLTKTTAKPAAKATAKTAVKTATKRKVTRAKAK